MVGEHRGGRHGRGCRRASSDIPPEAVPLASVLPQAWLGGCAGQGELCQGGWPRPPTATVGLLLLRAASPKEGGRAEAKMTGNNLIYVGLYMENTATWVPRPCLGGRTSAGGGSRLGVGHTSSTLVGTASLLKAQ